MLIDLRSFLIIFSLLGIIIAGSLTVYSVTSIDAFYFIRFLLITLISIILVSLFFNYVNLNRVLSAGWLLLVLNLALVLSVEIFGKEINGSKRWLDFGFLSLQPSEFMKISYALFVIQYLRFFNFKFNIFRSFLLRSILFITAAPIIIQPDLGTGLIYILSGLMLLFICGMRRIYFILMGLSAIFFILLTSSSLFGLVAKEEISSKYLERATVALSLCLSLLGIFP